MLYRVISLTARKFGDGNLAQATQLAKKGFVIRWCVIGYVDFLKCGMHASGQVTVEKNIRECGKGHSLRNLEMTPNSSSKRCITQHQIDRRHRHLRGGDFARILGRYCLLQIRVHSYGSEHQAEKFLKNVPSRRPTSQFCSQKTRWQSTRTVWKRRPVLVQKTRLNKTTCARVLFSLTQLNHLSSPAPPPPPFWTRSPEAPEPHEMLFFGWHPVLWPLPRNL